MADITVCSSKEDILHAIHNKKFFYLSSTLGTTLHHYDNNIGQNPDEAKYISDALKSNSTITTLYLNDNNIDPDGAKYISDALKSNSTLTTLDLNKNNIGPDGAKYISDALKSNSTLTTLNLYYNNI